jgi:ribosome-binding protein aMBF1 (putative translation factor)
MEHEERRCLMCGISELDERLYDVIYLGEVVKMCNSCAEKEDAPMIRKPTTLQLKESEQESVRKVYDKITGRGLNSDNKFQKKKNLEELKRTTLKDIMASRVKFDKKPDNRPKLDLVDNFHWIIMRARKFKHLSHRQLAREIGESEMAVRMVEQGELPEDDYKIIGKLEDYLGLKLMKGGSSISLMKKPPARALNVKSRDLKNLTIADLKKMKEEQEEKKDLKEHYLQPHPHNEEGEYILDEDDDKNHGWSIADGEEIDFEELKKKVKENR